MQNKELIFTLKGSLVRNGRIGGLFRRYCKLNGWKYDWVVTLGTTKKMVQELKWVKPFPLIIVDDFFSHVCLLHAKVYGFKFLLE